MESFSFLRFLIAASTVLALLGMLALALKYLASRGLGIPLKGKSRRLQLIENLSLDARHRLVIIKCDEAEHLLLLGTQHDRVVATHLTPPPPSQQQSTENP